MKHDRPLTADKSLLTAQKSHGATSSNKLK
jgi:hypothetical protein